MGCEERPFQVSPRLESAHSLVTYPLISAPALSEPQDSEVTSGFPREACLEVQLLSWPGLQPLLLNGEEGRWSLRTRPALTPNGGLQGVPQHQLPPQYQKILERLKVLEREISGGAMAVVAVLLNNKLYVANVGEPPARPWGGPGGRPAWGTAFFGQLLSRYMGSPAACRGHWVGFPGTL